MFLAVYILLVITFGYTMVTAETALGRMTRKSPIGAFSAKRFRAGGWLHALIPLLIVPYYSVIGGWVMKYLFGYLGGRAEELAADGTFSAFLSGGLEAELYFVLFTLLTAAVIFSGVQNGIERVSKILMPFLFLLAVVISVFSMTRPGAGAGIRYFLVPDMKRFSWMTVVSAMGQMFYSLSIAMGILITFGSYMKDDVSVERSTLQVEFFDTGIAILSGLMIIPAVFAFSGGDPNALKTGPSLMFVTMPKIFAEMSFGRGIAVMFFVLVLFAALTSAIALTESAVSTFSDELGWSRRKGTVIMAFIMLALGTLSCLGYGPLSFVTLIGMPFLDFFDFLTNSVMMPVAAFAICLLVTKHMGIGKVEEEVTLNGHPFILKKVFSFMIEWVCPIFVIVILLSSVANAFGIIKI